MKNCIYFCVLFSALIALKVNVEAGRILAVTPTAGYSHFIGQHKLYKALAAAGHEITVVSTFPNKAPVANYTDVHLTTPTKFPSVWWSQKEVDDTTFPNQRILFAMSHFCGIGNDISEAVAFEESFQNLLKSNAQFDVILIEFFLDDFLIGLGHHFNAPIIGISTVGANKWVNDYIGNPSPLSYVPHTYLSATNSMTFYQRIVNVLMTYVEEIYMELVYHPKQEVIYNKAFPDPKPSYDEARKNAVHLVFVNSHFSLSSSRPQLSNVIEVGGMHINREKNPLPKDIESFIDSAKNDVVYFSLGSNIRPSLLTNEMRNVIIQSLLKLDAHVICKWDKEIPEIAGKKNFYVSEWLPQSDILRHPKVKLFITHGGLQSTFETIYHGVPIVGIPFFGDQDLNMAKAEQLGYGKAVNAKVMDEKMLTAAINEVLTNEEYKERIMTISERYRDTPVPPLQLAKYWVEYVIRHKGANHMRSGGMDLNFFQLHSIDTLGVILAVVLISISVVVMAIRKLFVLVKSPHKKLKIN